MKFGAGEPRPVSSLGPWTRGNGQQVVIAEMNDYHLQAACQQELRWLRGMTTPGGRTELARAIKLQALLIEATWRRLELEPQQRMAL